jgi:hypothetical protein
MNEIDVVVDVRQSPDTSELIVLKQKVAFGGEASLIGAPVEARVSRVGEEHVWPFLQRSGIVVHRRAAPRFGTLLDADRLAVIRAVAPLRGAQPGQWAAAGANPLEWAPSNFVVRAGEDLSVVVTPAPDKGVEIVDIVRQSALEQFDGQDKGPKQ